MCRACHVIYTIIKISTPGILINLLQYLIPLAVHTRAHTLNEPIQTWHTGTMIRTREWTNNKRSRRYYCLCSFIMLIENQWSRSSCRVSVSCAYPRSRPSNAPLVAQPRPSAKRGAGNGKLMKLYTIGRQHYHLL